MLPGKENLMLDPRMVEDVIDDVLGNKKDPYRLTRDFLKQVEEAEKRINRLEKKLATKIHEKDNCGSLWTAALTVLEQIEELERLVERAKAAKTATVSEVGAVIDKVEDEKQRMVLRYRYIDLITDWKEIGLRSDISRAAAQRKHKEALPEVQKILNDIEARKKAEDEADKKAAEKERNAGTMPL